MHASFSMPSLSFRSSHMSGSVSISPPSSPHSSLFSDSSAAYLDFPFVLPTSATSSTSSPSSSPLSLSTDDSSDYGTERPSHWRTAGVAASSFNSAPPSAPLLPPWHESVVPLSLDRSFPRLPSPHPPNPSYRSGSLGSSASSVSSDSNGSSTPTRQSTQVALKKRKRGAAALNADERLQRRRAQHRAVDANRRQKENEAITRLHRLIRQQQQQQVVGEVDDDSGECDEDDSDNGSKKAGRLTVLESSIALIEQLTSACKRMDAACNAKDAQVSRVSNQLHSVAAVIAQQASSLSFVDPMMDGIGAAGLGGAYRDYSQSWHPSLLRPNVGHGPSIGHSASSASTFLSVLPTSTSSYLVHSDMSHTLRQSTTSLLSNFAMSVIALPSKVVIDVNDRFLSMTGHRRSDMMYQSLEDVSMKDIPQYPASVAAVNEVIDGSRRQGSAVWRCRWADGLLHENGVTFYALFDEPPLVDERRAPERMLLICTAEDAVTVDQDIVL